jgi:hypothetical protein
VLFGTAGDKGDDDRNRSYRAFHPDSTCETHGIYVRLPCAHATRSTSGTVLVTLALDIGLPLGALTQKKRDEGDNLVSLCIIGPQRGDAASEQACR